jgi:phosphomannomutase
MGVIKDSGIFKAYDIRGIYGDTLNEDIAIAVGKAFAVVLKPTTVVDKMAALRVHH